MRMERFDWTEHLVLTRRLTIAGDRTAHFEAVNRGEFTQIARGAYVPAALWSESSDRSRHVARIQAAAVGSSVLSHFSAAAMWRLPFIHPIPPEVHITVEPTAGGRSSKKIRRHAVGVPSETAHISGLCITTLARTVVDMACMVDFGASVCMADAALRRTTRPVVGVPRTFLQPADLRGELEHIPTRHGSARAAAVVAFADGLADRPGESLSRVSMHSAGITSPQLQVPLVGASGKTHWVDFFWPEFNVIGEFDGRMKYSDPEFLKGRTPEQAVIDEKTREDDLRAAGYTMSRWYWETAISPNLLKVHLNKAGVH